MRTVYILFCVLLVSNISYAEIKEYLTFNVYHTPPTNLTPNKDLKIEITIYEPENVSTAYLSFRNAYHPNYHIIFLKRHGAIFSGTILSSEIRGDWIEYFISIIDIQNEVRPVFYNDKKPYRVSIINTPPENIEEIMLKEKREGITTLYDKNYTESPIDVIILDKSDLGNLYINSLPELLRNFQGMDIRFFQQGFYRIGIRGFADRNNQVMTIIDGRKTNSRGYGTTFWQRYDMLGITAEKVEIIRGPGSYIYGANAYGGVVKITTYEPANGVKGEFSAGNFHSLSVYANGGIKNEPINIGFFAGHSQNNYFEHPDLKASDNETVTLKTNFSPSYNIQFNLTGGYTKSVFPLPTSYGDYTGWSENSYVFTRLNLNKFYIKSYWDEDNVYSLKPIVNEALTGSVLKTNIFPIPVRTDDFRVESGYSYPTGDWNTLVAGGEGAITVYDAVSTDEPRLTEKTAGAFLLDEIKPFEKLILTLSYRFDWSSIHEPGNSSLIGLTILTWDDSAIRISTRRGFRVPSYLEYILSDRDLGNENINTIQLDYYKKFNLLDINISLYYNKITNLVDFSFSDNRFENVLKGIENYGTEVGFKFLVTKKIMFFSNYSFLKTSKQIKSNPYHRTNGGIIFKNILNINGTLTFNYTSSYTEEIYLNEILSNISGNYAIHQTKPYLLINLKLSYPMFNNSVELGFRGNNLMFHRHFESSGITTLKDPEVTIGGEKAGTHVEGFITAKF